jgi:hypothetical protein
LAAHSRSRLVPKKKTLFLADGLFFSLDRCLLMGDPMSFHEQEAETAKPLFFLMNWDL